MTLLVTGAAGFIGSGLVRQLRRRWPERRIVSYDALTYAGSRENLGDLLDDPNHVFVQADITDGETLRRTFDEHGVTGVLHLAAESHVDRSIVDPMSFVRTNVEGTATLLMEAARVWGDREDVRFLHVSTDEVFGSLSMDDEAFTEATPYAPRSPYSASKAAGDHLVRAWQATYGLPVVLTNCSNNYGPRQFPEKLIPLVIARSLAREPVPVYGRGENVRDWIHVDDHCAGLIAVFERGTAGETYCLGGECEISNIRLVEQLLDTVDDLLDRKPGTGRELITFVGDRPGHDFRYAMDVSKARRELGWSPRIDFSEGLKRTVSWYLDNPEWHGASRTEAREGFEKDWYRARSPAQGDGSEP